jgi:hypothetical protein
MPSFQIHEYSCALPLPRTDLNWLSVFEEKCSIYDAPMPGRENGWPHYYIFMDIMSICWSVIGTDQYNPAQRSEMERSWMNFPTIPRFGYWTTVILFINPCRLSPLVRSRNRSTPFFQFSTSPVSHHQRLLTPEAMVLLPFLQERKLPNPQLPQPDACGWRPVPGSNVRSLSTFLRSDAYSPVVPALARRPGELLGAHWLVLDTQSVPSSHSPGCGIRKAVSSMGNPGVFARATT